MKPYTFRIIIETEKPSGYHGFVPLLRGLHTYGQTLDEIKKNIREAIICHVQALAMDGEPIPQESDALEIVQTFSTADIPMTAVK